MSVESLVSADRLVDERLPRRSESARKDQIVPKVDQQGSIDDRLDVLWTTLPDTALTGIGTRWR